MEAAFSPDGKYAYVSNYSMYGEDFGPEGDDECTPSSGYDEASSTGSRLETLEIDDAYRVGSVPKVVAVTPDGSHVLVANWCTWDLSVISTRAGREVRRIPMGEYPRGVTVSPDGDAAYVGDHGRRLPRPRRPGDVGDLDDSHRLRPAGARDRPRRGEDLRDAERGGQASPGSTWTRAGSRRSPPASCPRSLAIAGDAKAIYVVNYESGTVSKLRTRNMEVLQTVDACYHPIGIAYDTATRRVWVACYGGSILVYDDRR